jgi:YHYH protein
MRFSNSSCLLFYFVLSLALGVSLYHHGPSDVMAAQADFIDIHRIPLGDGKVSLSPKNGFTFSCRASFNGGGAHAYGQWIHDDTWDSSEKIAVQGSINWSDAQIAIFTERDSRIITGNGLPVSSKTGIFPIQQNDPAYQIDRNPNSIKTHSVNFSLPLNPKEASTPSCVGMGMVGIALNGTAIFNALDGEGRDAVAHEVQDSCGGHPERSGLYHYHGPSPCQSETKENNTLIGYALDGFGIYSMYDANGKELTNSDLDSCHGTTSPVLWNGKITNIYHYVQTQEYPYMIGCYHGIPVRSHMTGDNRPGSDAPGGPPSSENRRRPFQGGSEPMPPQSAIEACDGKTQDRSCSINHGPSGSCEIRSGVLACVPD